MKILCYRYAGIGLIFIAVLFFRPPVFAQDQAKTAANYSLAERFSPDRLDKMVFDTKVTPHWLASGNCFWYTYKTTKGVYYYLVDADRRTKTYLFDNHKMAGMLTAITKDPYDHQHLPPINPKFTKDEAVFQFDVAGTGTKKTYHLEYNRSTGRLYEQTRQPVGKMLFRPGWLNISSDSAYAVYTKGNDLYYMDKENYLKASASETNPSIVEYQLTGDGAEGYAYGKSTEMRNPELPPKEPGIYRQPAKILWSPDSKKFALIRKDNRNLKPLWLVNSLSSPRPTLLSFPYQMPGEVDATEAELLVFTIAGKKTDTIAVKQFHNQTLRLPDTWLSGNPDELYFSRQSRDLQQYQFCSVNLESKKVKVLIEEKMNTYVDAVDPILISGGKEMICLSERDGWAHFYLYDNEGHMKKQITSGPWHCSYDGYSVDEKKRLLYFNANGREQGEDPYYRHFYKIKLDGTGLTLLNKGNFDHDVEISNSRKYFVDSYSRVNTAPKSELRDCNGRLVLGLETADLSSLFAAGYKFPEPFKVKADDGQTDIYGVMYKPFDFDSTKTYPVIEYVYPGPHTEFVNKSFSTSMDRTDRMAQLGFVVLTLGNRGGSPQRSKWYHNYGYGNLRDYGLADKKYAVEQLATRHRFIDRERVGIYGHSGGGFMSAAAICQYPDFYKVAISASGNHDNTIYNHLFTEKYNGIKEILNEKDGTSKFRYDVETNTQLVPNLKGHLLLVTGDMDSNVHPANTYRMADALIKANKRFDIFILPGQTHSYRTNEYCFWLFADYFSKHLLGNDPASVNLPQ